MRHGQQLRFASRWVLCAALGASFGAGAFLSARPKWTLTVALDPQGKLPELLQPPKMPTSYLIDGNGVLRFINAGFERADAKKIESRLLALAAESS
jgi:hypothetical protein